MTDSPKKRPGRPRKSALVKPEQFSIRLPLLSKLALEMIARDRNLSLSQAVEHIINEAADHMSAGDGTLASEAREGIGRILQHMGHSYGSNSIPGQPLSFPTSRPIGHLTDAERAIAFPEALRDEGEQFFYEVVRDLDFYHGLHVLEDKKKDNGIVRPMPRSTLRRQKALRSRGDVG